MKLNNTQNLYIHKITMRLMLGLTRVVNGSHLVKPLDWLAL